MCNNNKLSNSLLTNLVFNPLMHKIPKWSDTLKNLAGNIAKFLKCV